MKRTELQVIRPEFLPRAATEQPPGIGCTLFHSLSSAYYEPSITLLHTTETTQIGKKHYFQEASNETDPQVKHKPPNIV